MMHVKVLRSSVRLVVITYEYRLPWLFGTAVCRVPDMSDKPQTLHFHRRGDKIQVTRLSLRWQAQVSCREILILCFRAS